MIAIFNIPNQSTESGVLTDEFMYRIIKIDRYITFYLLFNGYNAACN
jgi:hypothetical protein